MNRNFRSCFVVDVQVAEKSATLTDSSRNRYTVDLSNDALVDQFKSWLHNVFLKGISQKLTIIEYANIGTPPDIELSVVKFLTTAA